MRRPSPSKQLLAVGILTLTTIALALCLAAVPARAQSTLTFTEWPISPSSNCPFNLVPLSRNVIYFTESRCNGNVGQVGRLNANTNEVTEWSGSALIIPQGVIAMGDSILFTDGGANTINMLNPDTGSLKTWSTPSTGALDLVAVGTKIFFTELNGSKIGMLDLVTNNIAEWTVSGGLGGPLGIAATDDGSGIWFSALSAPQLGVLHPGDNTFQQWTLPSNALGHHVQHVAVSEEDHVFFVDDFSGTVGSLNPNANVITVWTAPSPPAGVVDLQVRQLAERKSEAQEPFRADFTDSSNGNIGRLLTALQAGTSTTVLPTTTLVTPAVTPVAPSTTTLTPTRTLVAPTVTSVAGVITGGFEEWAVPTPNSDTYAIAELPGGGVAFSEANGNKIGTLR